MSNEQMKRIFDQNDCLTPRQLKGYVSGSLVHEEAHAVEAHIMGCPLCQDAVEGVKAHRVDRSIDTMETLSLDFLEGHSGFKNEKPAAAATPTVKIPKVAKVDKGGGSFGSPQLLRTVSIAATVLIAAGVFWFIKSNSDNDTTKTAQNVTTTDVQTVEPQEPVDNNAATLAVQDTGALVADEMVATDTVLTQVPTQDDALDKREQVEKYKLEEANKLALAKKRDSVKKVSSTVAMTTAANAKKVPVTVDTRGRMGNSYTSQDASDISIAGARGSGNLYKVDGTQVSPAPPLTKTTAETAAKDAAPPKPLTADELYDQKKYNQALTKYTQQLKTTDGKDREDAKLGMAKCYIALGNEKQAESILRGMLFENSKRKRQAKKLLKSMGIDEE